VAAGLAITGCGHGATQPAGSAVVAAAERTTAHRISLNETTFVRTSPHDYVEMTVVGYVDGRDRTGSIVVAAVRKGRGRASRAAKRLESFDGFVIHAGPRTYQRYFAFNRRVGLKSSQWVLIDPADPFARALDFSQNVVAGAMDPTLPVDHLRAVVGEDRLAVRRDGQGLEHHRVTVDLDRYVGMAPPAARDTVRASVDRYRKLMGRPQLLEDVWIDRTGRIAQVKAEFSRPGQPPALSWVLSLRPTEAHARIPAHAVPLRKLAPR
jgi:hypothetical protein